MAQRMIHALLAEKLMQEEPVRDPERFVLGSILPDAYQRRIYRDDTHFVQRLEDGRVYYDFRMFAEKYAEQMQDDLYLGYYMHLAEDVFYRTYIRCDRHLEIFGIKENVRILHRDYQLLNAAIVQKYGLVQRISGVPDLAGEPLMDIAPLRVPEFLQDFAQDFQETLPGEPVFVNEEMLAEFLDRYYPKIREEYLAVKHGYSAIDPQAYAWQRTGE